MKYFCFLIILSTTSLFAKQDTARWDFRIKGIDFKVGRSAVFSNMQQSIAVVKSATPEESRGIYNYDSLTLEQGSIYYHPVRLRLACVIGNNKTSGTRFLRKSEFCFGLSFDIQNEGANRKRFSNLRLQNYLQAHSLVYLSYAYQCESIDLSYQFVSKVFFKHFAAFGGANLGFGYNTYKRIDIEDGFYRGIYVKYGVFNTSYLTSYGHLGLKYNLSCELNLFAQAETGLNFYGKLIGGKAPFNAFCFGIRYKIIDEQDRKNYLNSSFW